MPKPVVVTISHTIGRQQAASLIRERLGAAKTVLGTYRVAVVRDDWEGDRLNVELSALGQKVQATVDVLDDHARIEAQLPWVLAAFAEKIRTIVEQKAPALLGPPNRTG